MVVAEIIVSQKQSVCGHKKCLSDLKQALYFIYCTCNLYSVNGIFFTNCPVLRGQMNVSFRKADFLLFSSRCVGRSPGLLEREQTSHSHWAAKDCMPACLLRPQWVKTLWRTTTTVFFLCERPPLLIYLSKLDQARQDIIITLNDSV